MCHSAVDTEALTRAGHGRWCGLSMHSFQGVGIKIHVSCSAGFSLDDWVWASVTLYLDIINLFLYLMQIIGRSQRN